MSSFEIVLMGIKDQVLDVTESRVSQLRTRALKALREELATALAE